MEYDTVRFREWLLEVIGEHDINQSVVARRVGVSPSRVSDWINGKKRPRRENAIRLAEEFGADPNHILGLTGHEPLRDTSIDLDDPLVQFSVANAHRLTPARKRALIEMARTMIEETV